MGLFNKIWSGLRGHAHETGQSIVDANALTILDQEIRDADKQLHAARDQLSMFAAKRAMAAKEVDAFEADRAKYLDAAKKALEKGNEDLARRSAERVAQIDQELSAKRQVVSDYQGSEDQMRQSVSAIEAKIKSLKQQVETVKANDAVIKAQAAVASTHAGMNSRLGDASQSLKRIKERQAMQRARMAEAEKLEAASTGADLDAALAEAGITGSKSSADDILASLRG
ncbi:MAG: PspA/IM30 family protein [Rhodothalassiaceae bacterium]